MNRSVQLLRVTLSTESPLSVASPESASLKDIDLPIAREPFGGQPYIPATSIIGSLRAHAAAVPGIGEDSLLGLFGGAADEGDGDLRPSMLRAMGSALEARGAPTLRQQTAIDRWRGAARSRSLRSREELGAGTRIHLYLCMVGAEREQESDLKQVLRTWQPLLGGGRSTGSGRCRVAGIHSRVLDLTTDAGLQAWLELGGPDTWDVAGWESWPTAGARPAADVRFGFSVFGDLQVGTGTRKGSAAETFTRDGRPVVPGTALKGVFRSRAEFILRTLGLRSCASTGVDDGAGDGLASPCRSDPCLTCRLFGYSGSGTDDPGQRSVLWFSDAAITNPLTEKRTHVALDRFSGGQSHGLLFTQEVVSQGHLSVDVTIADPGMREVAEALLSAVAWDIHDGYSGVGHGTARGMGSLRLSEQDAGESRQRWLGSIDAVRAAAESGGPAK